MINAGKMSREEALRQEEAMLLSFEKGLINNVVIEKLLINEMGLSRKECAQLLRHSRMERHENSNAK